MRRTTRAYLVMLVLLSALLSVAPLEGAGGGWTIIGWNNLGMHCMDGDYTVFSILPPYNTIHAQVIDPQGRLATASSGIIVTYEAIQDPQGSINTTSIGKTGFWQHVQPLYGSSPSPDTGLTGKRMPGSANTPRLMDWDAANRWFIAEGIPITPYEDGTLNRNAYPMMRLTAIDAAGSVLAATDIVLPVSDEMDCRACHASGSGPAAMPRNGWVNQTDPQVDYRLNILLLHDDMQNASIVYQNALAMAGFNPGGLYPTATTDQRPILCAACHASNALPGTGLAGIPQLTLSIHGGHATVIDPVSGLALGNSVNRSACYRCHPGAETRCLRGAMGKAVAGDGSMEMQCQSCHGTMSAVGGLNRVGWLDQPACQNCHTGTAVSNNGQIRYSSAIDAANQRRVAVNSTFATNQDTPLPGFSLYRFSFGHGGLACESCHGSTHAEYPTTHENDNVQSVQLQGHAGVIAECTSCHAQDPATVTGGPHGLHPTGQSWVSRHGDAAENGGTARCQACHGSDYKGSVLSVSMADQTVTSSFGQRELWKGFRVSCFACHEGPSSEHATANKTPRAQDNSLFAFSGAPTTVALVATDPDGDPLALRIISQPAHGTVGVSGRTATYFPDGAFQGSETFTFAAWDGKIDSNLGTVTTTVGPNTCVLTCSAAVPSTGVEGTPVAFEGSVSASLCIGQPVWSWTFGDGRTSGLQNPSPSYAHAGTYDWMMEVRADAARCTAQGTITVQGLPPQVTLVRKTGNNFQLQILGSNFHSTIKAYISGTEWGKISRVNDGKLVLTGGNSLKKLFPAGAWVTIRLVNTDDNLETSVQYNRSTNKWRPVP